MTALDSQYNPVENIFEVGTGSGIVQGTIPNIMWHITDVCPLGCPYCFAPKTELSLPSGSIEHIVACMKVLGVQKADISGGEPLVHPDFPSIAKNLRAAGIHATLTTSGVGSKKNRSFVCENTALFSRVIVSLDGPNEVEHSRLRRYPDAWSQLVSLLDGISASEKARCLRVNTVITSKFHSSWIDEFIASVSAFGVREWCLIEPHPANAKPEFLSYNSTDEHFSGIVADVVSRDLPFKILQRTRKLYSSYWSLQPSGILRQHTLESHDRNEIDLLKADTSLVRSLLTEWNTELPREARHEST